MSTPSMWRMCLAGLFALAASTPVHAQDGSVRREGFDLHYRTVGAGLPVVLLSGGPGLEVDYMESVAEFLPASYQRVFLEQRGTGRSKLPALTAETMTLRLVVDDLEALRVALKQERLFLVGHSWGGMLAMAYAAAYPDRVDRLILVGSGGPTLKFVEWFEDNITARMTSEDIAATTYWTAAEARGVDEDKAQLEIIRAKTPAYFFDRGKGLACAAQFVDGSFHNQVNNLLFADLEKKYDLRPGLRLLKRPVLIVQGHQDPMGDVTAEEIRDVISGSQLRYINKAGHFPWLERPEEFQQILAEFLKDPR